MSQADCKLDDSEEGRSRDLAIIRAHANQLSEQFDTVQIICTRFNGPGNGTIHAAHGAGNWYARYGSVKAWLVNEDAGIGTRE